VFREFKLFFWEFRKICELRETHGLRDQGLAASRQVARKYCIVYSWFCIFIIIIITIL